MKKILIFSLAYYPHHVSGAEAAVKEITDRSPDIEFHMVTLRWKGDRSEEKIGNVMVHRVGVGGSYISKALFPVLAARKARALHSVYHFDCMWALMTYMLLPTMLAKLSGVSIPHIVSLQDGDPYEKVFSRARIRPFLPLIDWGFRTAGRIQAISTYLASWPEKRGYHGEVLVIHNGANPKDVDGQFSHEELEKLKQKLGKKEGDIFLVNTARLETQKGNDVTIHALSSLPSHAKLLLVGGGTEENSLRDIAEKLGHKDRVIFTGQVSRDKITLYRNVGDIFVGPSRSEGLGNAFLSAMASGIPVVATQEGGLAEFIVGKDGGDAQTAWPVAKDSSKEIADVVQYLIANKDSAEVKVVIDRARKMVLEHYTWGKVAEEMHKDFFDPVLNYVLVERARKLAENAHAGQKRKTDASDYILHPKAVADLVAQEGADAATVAAAWVHDVVEDTGVSLEEIRTKLGERVSKMVQALTEDKDLQWEKSKQQYIDTVGNADEAVIRIALADKVHNLRSLLTAHATQGKAVWDKFNRGKDKKLWFEEEMLKIFKEKLKTPLVGEYEKLVEKMRNLA